MTASRDPATVRVMFDRVAPRYDLANHPLSGGIDFWREEKGVSCALDLLFESIESIE